MENYRGYNLIQFSALPNYGSISTVEKHEKNTSEPHIQIITKPLFVYISLGWVHQKLIQDGKNKKKRFHSKNQN